MRRHERERWQLAVRDFLAGAEPTRWGRESRCRYIVRGVMCLRGVPWERADHVALELIRLAYATLRASHRPSWADGQPLDFNSGQTRNECEGCGNPVTGSALRFCSPACRARTSARRWRQGFKAEHESLHGKTAAQIAEDRRRASRDRTCEACGSSFQSRRKDTPNRFCSRACNLAFRHRMQKATAAVREKACQYCGAPFVADRKHPRQRFCSRPCASRWSNSHTKAHTGGTVSEIST